MGKTYYYLPRHVQIEDLIMGEDIISKFTIAIPIEMFMQDTTGFEGDKEMFSKFGLEIRNSYKLVVSKDRWETEVKSHFDSTPGISQESYALITNLRPQEGDLIYDPLTSFIFEIKFVDHDVEFFQVGKNYKYTLSCEAFQYSQEEISTGIPEIDAFETDNTIDQLAYQLKTENDEMIVLEGESIDEYLLQENNAESTARPYGTDFVDPGLLIEFSTQNPFGGL